LIEKNRAILKTKHFQNSIVLLFAFNFFSIFDNFFFILLLYGFQKNLKIIVLFYCMYPRFYQKIVQNYGFFFTKKLRYVKSKISTKFHCLQSLF